MGDAGVGKTSLIHQLTRKKFSQQVNPSLAHWELLNNDAGDDHLGRGLQRQEPPRARPDHHQAQLMGRSRSWAAFIPPPLLDENQAKSATEFSLGHTFAAARLIHGKEQSLSEWSNSVRKLIGGWGEYWPSLSMNEYWSSWKLIYLPGSCSGVWRDQAWNPSTGHFN